MLTSRFEQALVWAAQLHARQVRKSTSTPYIAHLMAVSSLVLEAGGDEDQAIAALLHDAVEDQGGMETLHEIRRRFGDRVARIVEACTDSYVTPKPPWRQRKETYLIHLRSAPPDARLVSLADKLHNARTINTDLRQEGGKATWGKFNGGKDGTLWYYIALLEVFRATGSDPMTDELGRVVHEMGELARIE